MINILDEKTINRIAAGEVVEKPVSVVKELVENAIDSGAGNISVEIKGGGIVLIRVTDNGCGIGKESIPLAFLRHATSKITSIEDLTSIISAHKVGDKLTYTVVRDGQTMNLTITLQEKTKEQSKP